LEKNLNGKGKKRQIEPKKSAAKLLFSVSSNACLRRSSFEILWTCDRCGRFFLDESGANTNVRLQAFIKTVKRRTCSVFEWVANRVANYGSLVRF